MRLFKFVDSRGVDILENERIKFTPPNQFKDPFEFRPAIAKPSKKFLKQRLGELLKGASSEWWESPDAPKGFNRSQRRQEDLRIKKEAIRKIRSGEEPFPEKLQDSLADEVGAQFGVLCLCAVNNENLMWYHCADGHKGFVIEFNSEHAEFQKLGKPTGVIYSDKPPIYDLSNPTAEHWRVKPKYLKYEAEYRILARLPASTPHKMPDGQPLYLARLSRASVKAVYLGHRMEKSVREKILQILNGTTVSKFDAIPSREDYTLSFREITN
jgi:hypothetical protein